jgi:rhodanese-related sulfurtransferase
MDIYLEFAGNHPLLVSALVFSFFLLIFTELQRKARGLTNIEPQDAVKLINSDAVVIDLRSAEAFARGHIVNARNVPIEELPANQDKIAKYGKKPIVAVCDAGMTSGKVVESLRKSGIENAYGLKGGINAWTQANLPLVTAKKTRKTKKKTKAE